MLKTKQLSDNDWVDEHALDIIRNLTDKKFTAYLVGGSVRDYLAGVPPKDFDITTDALPNQIKRLVRRAYIIGKRFRLVLVQRDAIQYEVATFRRDPTAAEKLDLDIENDNLFGEPEPDALRRDFTINAMFYDPKTKMVIDYAGGLDDIEAKTLRIIGDPVERLIEDPIRILRALRLSHKLLFQIEPSLRKAIQENHSCLANSPLPRIREDLLKILRLPAPERCLFECFDLGITQTCFPLLDEILAGTERSELFATSLARSIHLIEDPSDPKELLLGFSYAILKAMSACEEIDPWDIELHERVFSAFKDEFGMFKGEIEFIQSAICSIPSFTKLDTFLKRGRKRQFNFIAEESFPYALKLAHWDYYINTDYYVKWKDLYLREISSIAQKDIEKMKQKYRKKRPRS